MEQDNRLKKGFICSPLRPKSEIREEREPDWNRNTLAGTLRKRALSLYTSGPLLKTNPSTSSSTKNDGRVKH